MDRWIPIFLRSFKGACHLDALAGQPSRARTGGVIVYVSPKDCHLNREHGWNWNKKYTMGSGCFLFRHWIFWMFFFTKCSDKNKWGVYRTKPGAVFHPRDHRWSFERVIMCKKKKKHLPKRDAWSQTTIGFRIFWMDSEQWRFLLNGN